MKRDMNLVRRILLRAEKEQAPFSDLAFVDESTHEKVVDYHIHMMEDAGFIEVDRDTQGGWYRIIGITWEGHELLASMRRDALASIRPEITT